MNASLVLKGYHWPQDLLERTPDHGVFFLSMNMTSHCNYRCPYCFIGHENLKRDQDELSLPEKLDVLSQAKELGCRVLVMPGRGEPTADLDFWNIVDAAAALDIYVVVDTNIYLLDEEKIRRLKSLPVSLFAKVDSLDPGTYEYSVGRSGVYTRFRKNLDFLVEHFHFPQTDESGKTIVRLGINSVISMRSAASIPELHRWCAERSLYYTCRSPVRVGEAETNWATITNNDPEVLRDIGVAYARRDFTSATEGGHCGLYRFGITIENNGDIYVCPQARASLGNVRTCSLAQLIALRNTQAPLEKSAGYCYAKDLYNQEGAYARDPGERLVRIGAISR